VTSPEVVITTPSMTTNAVGRALSLANLFNQLGHPAVIVAPWEGRRWVGLIGSTVPVLSWREYRRTYGRAPRVLVAVKPFVTSALVVALMRRLGPDVRLIVDIDDADADLSREFLSGSVLARFALARRMYLYPSLIERTQKALLRRAVGITVSSHALAKYLHLDDAGLAVWRLPHPRLELPAATSPERRGSPDLGFFGTLRPHKGLDVLTDLLVADPEWTLHVYAGQTLSDRLTSRFPDRVVRHDPRTPIGQLYSQVDASILPQSDDLAGARYQLPAKLVDSLQYATPVLGQPTPAICEIAGESLIACTTVEDYSHAMHVTLDDARWRIAARRAYEENCSIATVSAAVDEILAPATDSS
jgi:hypothetical protein